VLLSKRLEAFAHALQTLRAQAWRLVRWQQRRKNVDNPKFTSTLRPGTPPGHRAKATAEVDFVLRECHALAFDVLKEDSS
jgi:ribosomal protein L44E